MAAASSPLLYGSKRANTFGMFVTAAVGLVLFLGLFLPLCSILKNAFILRPVTHLSLIHISEPTRPY